MAQKKQRSKKVLLILLCVVLLAAACAAGYYFFIWEDPALNVRGGLTLEAGEALPQAADFLYEQKKLEASFETQFPEDASTVPGTYHAQLRYGKELYPIALQVVDTTPPSGTVQDVTVNQTKMPQISDFIVETEDVTEVKVAYKQEPDVSSGGERAVVLVLTDTSGNRTELTAKLTVIGDEIAPEITGVKDIELYQGDTISYRNGVSVTDNMDEAPVLTIDNSAVDLSAPGVYTVTYSAVDYCGNQSTASATVTVYEKKEGYVDLETIYALADKTLARIVNDDMTDRQKVRAIYNWAHNGFSYVDHSDKSDWHQAAYKMLTTYRGDCFNYFAVTKLLFERLGIPNIDVVKVKPYPGAAGHYWSLVSVDGGETYYHFDATPRVNQNISFCLITDAKLDAYSNAHYNSHNRDKSLYPATPEE
ncbi:MAG: transglutaminase domain-containing protein [Oscillospiraceae bacterium]|nr:transglutaminase domain-containing protein [Oscillospiraceae bacterium]